MDLIHVVIILAAIWFSEWLFNKYAAIPQPAKSIIITVVVLLVINWLLIVTGVVGEVRQIRIGH